MKVPLHALYLAHDVKDTVSSLLAVSPKPREEVETAFRRQYFETYQRELNRKPLLRRAAIQFKRLVERAAERRIITRSKRLAETR